MAICEECDVVVNLEQAEREQRKKRDAATSRLVAANLPAAYRNGQRTMASLPPEVARSVNGAAAQMTDEARGLFLTGPAGTFKTSFACAYLAKEIIAGGTGRYVFVPNLFSDILASYAGFGISRNDIVSPLISTPRLVLDDLGKEKPSEHAASILFEILDGRYRNANGWTIVTSNLTLDAIAERFAHLGEEFTGPILRRLVELTVTVPMTVRGAA
jgi:DNA replication protein DnaC